MEKELESEQWQSFIRHRDRVSRDLLFARYKIWAQHEANRIFRQLQIVGAELAEFEQWAYQGMLEAIERFDPEQNIQFKSFAVHRVRGVIFSSLPHLSEVAAFYAKRGNPQRSPLMQTAQMAELNDQEPVSVLISLVMSYAVDYLLFDPDQDLTQLSGEFYSSPEINTLRQRVRDHVDSLDEPMKSVIVLYYFEQCSFGQIAQLVELTNGRVSQLHHKAIALLKQRIGW